MIIVGLLESAQWASYTVVLIELFRYALRLRRYERISIENRRFRSNGSV